MRLTLLALILALSVAACGKKDGEAQNQAGAGMTADAISTNDITAIDAVTGDAANMAADVDFNADAANALENAAEIDASSSDRHSKSQATPSAKSGEKTPAPTAVPAQQTPSENTSQ
jgi:hypothetical protein